MPPFDASVLLQEYGDESLVRDLAHLLVDTLPGQVDAVRDALAARNGPALRAAAHKLRGSISAFGLPDAVEAARTLESMGASGDLTGVDAVARDLVARVESLRESAKAWLDSAA